MLLQAILLGLLGNWSEKASQLRMRLSQYKSSRVLVATNHSKPSSFYKHPLLRLIISQKKFILANSPILMYSKGDSIELR